VQSQLAPRGTESPSASTDTVRDGAHAIAKQLSPMRLASPERAVTAAPPTGGGAETSG
jgi:hypothetical protein